MVSDAELRFSYVMFLGGLPELKFDNKRLVFSVQDKEKKKKESIFDLSKYIDKPIRVKFQGGREGEWINAVSRR